MCVYVQQCDYFSYYINVVQIIVYFYYIFIVTAWILFYIIWLHEHKCFKDDIYSNKLADIQSSPTYIEKNKDMSDVYILCIITLQSEH